VPLTFGLAPWPSGALLLSDRRQHQQADGDNTEACPAPIAAKADSRLRIGGHRARFLAEARQAGTDLRGFQRPCDLHLAGLRVRQELVRSDRREHHVGEPGLAGRTADNEPAWLLREQPPTQCPGFLQDALRLARLSAGRLHEPFTQPEDELDRGQRLHVQLTGNVHDQISGGPDRRFEPLPHIGVRNESLQRNGPDVHRHDYRNSALAPRHID
jgi:hypothetical protein